MNSIQIFDRTLLQLRRDRTIINNYNCNFLFEETAKRLLDRLNDIRHDFPIIADIGCHNGEIGTLLQNRNDIKRLYQMDISYEYARRAKIKNNFLSIVGDEEFLPFADESLNLILSNLSMHWVNDLPGMLIQIYRALKHDGLFLGCMFGGETLKTLHEILISAEIEEENVLSPRVSPFIDIATAGQLLQRSYFSFPVVDIDNLIIDYPNAMDLMRDLSHMGESNLLVKRSKNFTKRKILTRACELYQKSYGDKNKRIKANFQVLYLTGWVQKNKIKKY